MTIEEPNEAPLALDKDAIRQRLEAAFRRDENRIALRGHALYCASMVYNGVTSRVNFDTAAVTRLADQFLGWLEADPEEGS